MKFDVVIIGGGLSGLTCGIRLSQQGKKCAIISSGQSALHFSSGSFDLLNFLPEGTPVHKPLEKIDKLTELNPLHPYSKMGVENFKKYAIQVPSCFEKLDIFTKGSAEKNHFRITPMGNLKPTWLTLDEYAISPDSGTLPWKKVAIFNAEGFMDFYPRSVADEFSRLGTESEITIFSLPALQLLRRNPTEMRAANITRVLDKPENFKDLVTILQKGSRNAEVVLLPAFLGFGDNQLTKRLTEAVGKPVFILPTVPPSVQGMRTQEQLYKYFKRQGGVYMMGDMVMKAECQDDRVKTIYTYNHGDIGFHADEFVLATGSYFSQGLIATRDKVYEPIFNLDVNYDADRDNWYNENMFEKQNYMSFGVKTDNAFRALKEGKPFQNLYVAGAVLEGFNPIKEGSGSGVSLLTSLFIADNILSK